MLPPFSNIVNLISLYFQGRYGETIVSA